MKPIPNYSQYLVSYDGEIFRKDTKQKMASFVHLSGYRHSQLRNDQGKRKNVYIHRIVALAYLPRVEGKDNVNHIDGDKLNNKYTNLEWVNDSENQKHAWSNGLQPSQDGEVNPNAKLSNIQRQWTHKLARYGYKQYQLAEIFNASQTTISKILKNKIWDV